MEMFDGYIVIDRYPDYAINNQGDIKRITPARVTYVGRSLTHFKLARTGHHRVHLVGTDGKTHGELVHRLVLEAFVGPAPEGYQGLHWDDDVDNNCLTNLRWGTLSENQYDAVRTGHHRAIKKTHCPKGHEYNEANIYWIKGRWRGCRACSRERSRKRRAREYGNNFQEV